MQRPTTLPLPRPLRPALSGRAWPLAALGALLLAAGAALALWPRLPWAGPPFSTYRMPNQTDIPAVIAVAPDGTPWFMIDFSDTIGAVRGDRVETIRKPTKNVEPIGIAVDREGNVWFTDDPQHTIGRISPDGTIARFPVGAELTRLNRIAAAPDGAIWFADATSNAVIRFRDGAFTAHPIPTNDAGPHGVAVDPAGNVWFTEHYASKLGRLAPDGAIVEYDVPTRASQPADITTDPSGAIWFAEIRANKIARFADGRFTEYAVPSERAGLASIAAAPDGSIWYTATRTGKLGRIADGRIVEFAVPGVRGEARPFGVAAAPDGTIWFTDIRGQVGKLPPEAARPR